MSEKKIKLKLYLFIAQHCHCRPVSSSQGLTSKIMFDLATRAGSVKKWRINFVTAGSCAHKREYHRNMRNYMCTLHPCSSPSVPNLLEYKSHSCRTYSIKSESCYQDHAFLAVQVAWKIARPTYAGSHISDLELAGLARSLVQSEYIAKWMSETTGLKLMVVKLAMRNNNRSSGQECGVNKKLCRCAIHFCTEEPPLSRRNGTEGWP